ncbi:MAG: M81 family metallopeptidase [Anaerolineaceae bacterium]|nr:M81 family metallopeptidase [Anaerolineaceae bacterium]
MARIALAGFSHETNTFSPIATTYESFEESGRFGIMRTEKILGLLDEIRGKKVNFASLGFASVMEPLGHEVYPILITSTEPSGQIPADAFDRIVKEITDGLVENGPFDAVFLDLHGAMVFQDFNDGETEIIRRVRSVVGEIPISASFDLHGNITQECVDLASCLVGCRTYPHIDMYETGERCAHLVKYLFDGGPLYKAYNLLPFLWPLSVQSTFIEPCKSLYTHIEEIEKEADVLSATIMAGFPAADLEHMGPTIFTYGTTQDAADRAAKYLYDTILAREGEFRSELPDAEDAVLQAITLADSADKPVILADTCDNSGGGATSDTVGILEALLKHHAEGAAIAMVFDPAVVAMAHEAGEGNEIELDLGGKLVPGQTPFHGVFKVEKLFEGEFQGSSPQSAGFSLNMGKMAQLRIEGVRVVVSSVRTQARDREMFRVAGVNPEEMNILVVKSSNHFRADFTKIASSIITFEDPGANIENPENASYQNLREGVRLQGLGRVHKK